MIARVEAYLDARRRLGFQLRTTGAMSLRFARYADILGHHGPLTMDLAMRWSQEAATAFGRSRRMEVVRCFAKYQAALESGTEIPPARIFGPKSQRARPYIYTADEIASLMSAASGLRSRGGLRSRTYQTLIGLLACTGLRIGEALRLRRADIDLTEGVLSVRKTKFYKSRLVPLHPSAKKALRMYVTHRDAMVPPTVGATLFVGETGCPVPYRAVHDVWRKLVAQVGLVASDATRGWRPRIHDLRHRFAVTTLLRWYSEDVDVTHRIAALSTYIGHAMVSHTYWYLTGTPELLAIAAGRFERFGKKGKKYAPRQ